MSQMKTDIALIKQKSEFIEEKLEIIIKEMSAVKVNLSDSEFLKKKDLDMHASQDRWMFGLVITLLICIFGKLIYG